MGKKRRILSNPKFASIRKVRFPHLFTNEEPTAEEPALQAEAPAPAVEKVPEPKKVAKPKAKLSSKKTTKAKVSAKKPPKPAAKK